MRGRRSRPAFSRYLGYRSNIAQRWENGECWPTATRFFALCQKLRKSPKELVAGFLRREPDWLHKTDPFELAFTGAFLSELKGRTPLLEIATRTGFNRFSVSRWFQGTADPKLPELLLLIEGSSRRSLDFLAGLVSPTDLTTARAPWKKLQLLRAGACERPWSHAVLRALELRDYSVSDDPVLFLARKSGLSRTETESALEYLRASGQVEHSDGLDRPTQVGVVDTGGDPRRARKLRVGWGRRAVERLEGGAHGEAGYSLFSVSKRDLSRIRQLQLEYLRRMQSIIADSEDCDTVALYCVQLLELGE